MLNDNVPALSDETSIKDTTIQGSSVKTQIDLQESIIKDAQKAISAANSDIQLAQKTLAFLRGFDTPIPAQNQKNRKKDGLALSREDMIFNTIYETQDVNGIMTSEIKENIFQKYGVSISPTTIDDKIEKLMQEDKIFQVNQGYKRGKRYLAK